MTAAIAANFLKASDVIIWECDRIVIQVVQKNFLIPESNLSEIYSEADCFFTLHIIIFLMRIDGRESLFEEIHNGFDIHLL